MTMSYDDPCFENTDLIEKFDPMRLKTVVRLRVRLGIKGDTVLWSPPLEGNKEQQLEEGEKWLASIRKSVLDKKVGQPQPVRAFNFE